MFRKNSLCFVDQHDGLQEIAGCHGFPLPMDKHQSWLITVVTRSNCVCWEQPRHQLEPGSEERSQGSWRRTPRESLRQGLAIFTQCHARLFLPTGSRVPREAEEELVGAASPTSRNLLPSRTAAFAEPGTQEEAGTAVCKSLLQSSASKCQCSTLHPQAPCTSTGCRSLS